MNKTTQTILLWILVGVFTLLGVMTIIGGLLMKTVWFSVPCVLSGGLDLIIAILIAGDAAGNHPIY